MPSPIPNVLFSIGFMTRVDAWGVGREGSVIRLANGVWSNFPSGSDRDLRDIAVLNESEAWAVGIEGTILHYKGSCSTCGDEKWQPDPQSGALTLLPLNAVTFVNQANGWAVGGDPARGGIALHYNGAAWVSATRTEDALYDVFALASDNVWFCGEKRRLMNFDGSGFTVSKSPIVDGKDWHALDFPFLSYGWVVGDIGSISRYSSAADTWNPYSQSGQLTSESLRGLSILPDDERGYAVGTNGVRLHYDGTAFSLEAIGGEDLLAIDLVNEREGAAVGGSSLARIVHLRARSRESNLDHVRIYPNPFDPARDFRLTMDRLPSDVSRIEVFSLLGDRVADLSSGITFEPITGIASWPGTVAGGHPVATGSYIFRIRTRSGAEKGGVFLVVKR